MNENYRTSIQILQKFVAMGPIDKNSALVQVMVWHWADDKPISEQMMSQ